MGPIFTQQAINQAAAPAAADDREQLAAYWSAPPFGRQPDAQAPAAMPGRTAGMWPYLMSVGGAALDAGTTAYALSRPGFHEANPLINWAGDKTRIVAPAFVAAQTALTTMAMRKLASLGHPGAARVVGAIAGGTHAVAGLSNLRALHQQGAP